MMEKSTIKGTRWLLAATVVAGLSAATVARAQDPCVLPGVGIVEDPTGDTATPASAFADIQSVHMAEPANLPGKLVFTYKMADLSVVPPNLGWILRFSTGEPPPNGDEDFFVAMFSTPTDIRFVYGSDGAPAVTRLFNIEGDLDESSTFDADGTITLVLDQSKIPGLLGAIEVFNILPTVRVFAPTHDAGTTGNGANETILDDAATGFYVMSGGDCGEDKSAILGVGALPLPALMVLVAGLLLRVRRAGLAAMLAAVPGLALADGSGTLDDANRSLEYTSPSYVMANRVIYNSEGAVPACEEGSELCDVYTLTINLSDSLRADASATGYIDLLLDFDGGDWDLYVYDADGHQIAASENSGPELLTLLPEELPNGEYKLWLVPYEAVDASATLEVFLVVGDGKSGLSAMLGGAFGGSALVLLAGIAALRRRRN